MRLWQFAGSIVTGPASTPNLPGLLGLLQPIRCRVCCVHCHPLASTPNLPYYWSSLAGLLFFSSFYDICTAIAGCTPLRTPIIGTGSQPTTFREHQLQPEHSATRNSNSILTNPRLSTLIRYYAVIVAEIIGLLKRFAVDGRVAIFKRRASN